MINTSNIEKLRLSYSSRIQYSSKLVIKI